MILALEPEQHGGDVWVDKFPHDINLISNLLFRSGYIPKVSPSMYVLPSVDDVCSDFCHFMHFAFSATSQESSYLEASGVSVA